MTDERQSCQPLSGDLLGICIPSGTGLMPFGENLYKAPYSLCQPAKLVLGSSKHTQATHLDSVNLQRLRKVGSKARLYAFPGSVYLA